MQDTRFQLVIISSVRRRNWQNQWSWRQSFVNNQEKRRIVSFNLFDFISSLFCSQISNTKDYQQLKAADNVEQGNVRENLILIKFNNK